MLSPNEDSDLPSNIACRSRDPDNLLAYLTDPKEAPVYRTYVPDDKVSWRVDWSKYNPVEYVHPTVKKNPNWADPKNTVIIMNWNELNLAINRKSHLGEYEVVGGYPLNIIGRTGICGRGLLGKWGPNHAADPVVTRWKLDEDGKKVKNPKTKKKILQFVCIKRKDTGEWAIPGGMCDPGEKASYTMYREFNEEACNNESMSQGDRDVVKRKLKKFFNKGEEIYKGYVDDPRNTDNAWMETVVYNFHDDDRSAMKGIKLSAGDDASHAVWKDIDSDLRLYASHRLFIQQVVMKLDAHW